MEEIKITLETLYDILRNEKKREDLQKLEATFFLDVVNYLKEKMSFLEQRKSEKDLFASGERDKLDYELRSIKRIIKEIYEKREKKIIDIAMNRSRTGSDIIDTSAMLPEEKEFYLRALQVLEEFRHGVLFNVFRGEQPLINGTTKLSSFTASADYKFTDNPLVEHDSDESKPLAPPLPEETKPKEPEIPKTKIKFLHAVPSFVWKDLKMYGPFEIGDQTEIFPEVADLLVRKGRAEKI